MALTTDEVVICNQAADRIGATNFTQAVQTGVVGVRCNTHYAQTRDALQRLYEWPFAKWRTVLKAHSVNPDFEWDYYFKLPDDYLRMREDYTAGDIKTLDNRYEIEGDFLLTNDTEVEIKYIRRITDPNDFDPLFTEVLVLQLALKLVPNIAGTKNEIRKDIKDDLKILLSKVRQICRQESNISGRSDWNNARFGTGTVV